MIHDLEQAIARASRLVSTYLDIQKLEDGHTLSLEKKQVRLKPILEEELSLVLAPMEPHRREAFQFDIGVGEDAVIHGDPSRLSQIFGNLIENAVKYSPKGGRIQLRHKARNGYDHILIRDQGLGMSEEGRKKLFARFVRLEQDRAIRGTGLGLFIVRRLVESHGGRIDVESREGRGTTFEVVIPRALG